MDLVSLSQNLSFIILAQMMTAVILPAGALAGRQMFVKRLQVRIAKAVK